ncbi:hypothetical protein [Streptomyces sp. NPDC048338]|uniref:hypothetical protein n=1 Tax=Streptomyces sp. NPDC048338 TaxID=3365536 RepID=UPI003716155E
MFKSGVGILALFGFGWWLLGASAFTGAVWLVAVLAGVAATVGLLLTARRLFDGSRPDPLADSGRRRRFNQVNGLQWLLIAGVAVGCSAAGVPALIPPLVAVVVGLHFVPLAATFEQPRLKVPAGLLVAAGAAGAVVHLADGSDTSVRLVVGMGAALSLWGTATAMVLGMRASGGSRAEAVGS